MKKFNKKIILILACLLIAFIALIALAINVMPVNKFIISLANYNQNEEVLYRTYYENNVPKFKLSQVNFLKNDVREVQTTEKRDILINHSRGFALSFPKNSEYDFSAAQEFIKVKCKNMSAVISKEYSTYTDKSKTKQYVNESLNKFLLNERYIEQNKITIHKNATERIGDFWVQVVALSRTPLPDSKVEYNTYVYCYIYTDSTMFYRIMFKAPEYTDDLMNEIYRTLYSFDSKVDVIGVSDTFTEFEPIIPQYWSDETKAFYNELVNSDDCKWGIYEQLVDANEDFSLLNQLEDEIDYKFDGILEYMYYFEDIPIENMKKAYEQGKITELTLQTSTVMNENLDGYNPVFDIIDGAYDWQFKKIANQLKEFGHPVLFRLNNEMNSDWTSYGSSASLCDPEIYIEIWRKIYDIFKEEGVNNTIWIFNPNDQSYPPAGYNSTLAFYPGNEYVQVFGVTGYNTGTYYAEKNNEKWRTFKEIYDDIMKNHHRIYEKFPWIITEFASSSIGGDKAKWIEDMFNDLDDFPNIKMAFWFNSSDYDPSDETKKTIARPYWLNETPQTTKAFSDGIKKYKK